MANEETAPEICNAPGPNVDRLDGDDESRAVVPLRCARQPGHTGAHADADGVAWSAAPPLGPVPERFRGACAGGGSMSGWGAVSGGGNPSGGSSTGVSTGGVGGAGPSGGMYEPGSLRFASQVDWDRLRVAAGEAPAKKPLGVAVDPGTTGEVLVAGLVACGRALGRIEHELAQRRGWQGVLRRLDALVPQTEAAWASVGRELFERVKAEACALQSEPTQPIQDRAEALAILLLQGRRLGTTPNFLIRAGAVLEVLRAAWRKAQRGEA
jgi:hypothetical protein